MDIDSKIQEKNSVLNMLWNQLKWFPMKLINKINNIANNTINIGKNDPRKIWHASKVGLSLTLVILFYYSWPLYHSFEQSAIMAVLTVMVAFEYTAGATISKCLNIAFATALGVSLGIGAKYLAEICGKEGEPIILGFLVFILGALGTFTRFYPHMQRRYDYGCMFSVATFSLVTVSGDRYLEMVKHRISTIMVSVATVMVISLVIRPVWAGKDLHNLIIANLEKLASFLDANGPFRFNNPGKEYLKIGNLGRDCACHLHALSGHLKSKSKAPSEFHKRTKEACKRIIKKSSNALKYLALSIKTRTQPPCSKFIDGEFCIIRAIDELRAALLIATKTISEQDTIDVVTAMSVASILIDVARCVDEISKAVGELSIKEHFQKEKKKKDNSRLIEALEKKGEHVVCEIHAIEEEIKAQGK
ncbi:aluminum-activated malate transporter 8-like [Solanum pennellii]|uniref:Aluminum-activated malate transporter 8-like n=1 Tax=Solanum pennellii TaxID=28526 RepID=A0ABM1V261_SOLPN|nr:aluminum-activated malate transporter 8-like [Solanum pennellii]